ACGGPVDVCCTPACVTDFSYDVVRADLEKLRPVIGGALTGLATTHGRLTGSLDRPRVAGEASLSDFTAPEFEALTLTGSYDITSTSRTFDTTSADANLRGSFVKIFGAPFTDATATLSLADQRVRFETRLNDSEGRNGVIAADAVVHPDRREALVSG